MIIKARLKDLSVDQIYALSERFDLFSAVIDANSLVYLYVSSWELQQTPIIQLRASEVIGVCAITQKANQWTLDIIEVAPEYRKNQISKHLLKEAISDCHVIGADMNLSALSRMGRKYLINSLEFFGTKYGVYIDMPGKEATDTEHYDKIEFNKMIY